MAQFVLLGKSQLTKWGISPGDIYLPFKGKDILLLRTGEWIADQWVEKYAKKSSSDFKLDPFLDLSKLDVFIDRWKNLFQNDEFELEKSTEQWWRFVEQEQFSTLAWTVSTYQVFNKFEKNLCDELEDVGATLYTRSLTVGAVGCMLGMMMGFRYGKMLSDLYHLCCSLDVSLWEKGIRFETSKILEAERSELGSGLKLMAVEEKLAWEKHVEKSVSWLKQHSNGCLYDPNLIDSLFIHHERNDGTGMISKRKIGSFSDLEVILILADYLVDEEVDWKAPLSPKMLMEKLDNIPAQKNLPTERVKKYWRSIA